jgi:hypothetical protein
MKALRGIAILGVSLALQVDAQPAVAGPASADEVARAKANVAKAEVAVKEKRFAEAEALLSEAFALNPTYDVANNLGGLECMQKKLIKCEEHLSYASRNWPLTDLDKKGFHEKLDRTLAATRASLGIVVVSTNEPGAQVVVDGRHVGTTPLSDTVYVEPGSHTVEATLARHKAASRVVEVKKGSTEKVVIVLADDPTAAPTATVIPTNTASAYTAPTAAPTTAPTAPPAAGIGVGWAIGAGVLGAAGLVLGGVFTSSANGSASDASTIGARLGSHACAAGAPAVGDCADLHAAEAARVAASNRAVGGFVAGGAFSLAAAVLLVVHEVGSGAPPKAGRLGLSPSIANGHAGAVVNGTW